VRFALRINVIAPAIARTPLCITSLARKCVSKLQQELQIDAFADAAKRFGSKCQIFGLSCLTAPSSLGYRFFVTNEGRALAGEEELPPATETDRSCRNPGSDRLP
jgi:hypothetical protein